MGQKKNSLKVIFQISKEINKMVHCILQSDVPYVTVALAKTQKTCNTFNIARTMVECYISTFKHSGLCHLFCP